MTRHTRNRQMLKATNGKWGALLNRKVKNVSIAELNKMEIHLDKSFRWESGFEVESVHHKGNYRQQNSFGLGKFNPFYIYTFAQVSFERKGTSEKTRVYVSHQANGRVKVEEVITESWWNNVQ
ncbi:hypothetical protein [Bacillus thuringiensis]|uniref:hypothetical protein n=1 Tax=Bacillus thuringiensis TaxID=1428 RepID=UPI000A39B48A|nr:hypothetical protein [Bacillus thuringiensis]OTZ47956.1 hypothetical protein BK762_19935 [Bacillus thuringiensis serovar toumanoffi]